MPLSGVKVQNRSLGGLAFAASEKKHTKALYLSWAIMGLWHGANWTFLLWGLFHAIVISLYRLIEPITIKLNEQVRIIGGLIITLPIIMLAWVPFRADSISSAIVMWGKVLNPFAYTWLGMRENTYLITAFLLICIFITYTIKRKILPRITITHLSSTITDIFSVSIMFALVIIFLRPVNQFIYFQF